MRALLVAVIFSLAASEAHALKGAELYELCISSDKGSFQDLSCLSYVRGFVDGIIMGKAAGELGSRFCAPAGGISAQQGRLIAEKYLRDHPEALHNEAGSLLGVAFAQAFPCRK